MNRPRYLVLHKKEWDRLKRIKSPEKKLPDRSEYLKSLIEQSQNWINMWPDTVQGHVYQLKKQKEEEHQQLIEKVKQYSLKKKRNIKMESIRRAREMIFEDSCYGRQLLSALIESKTLEEREKQIKFKRQIKSTVELEQNSKMIATYLPSVTSNEKDKQMNLDRKRINVEVALINKEIAEKVREKQKKDKENYEKFDILHFENKTKSEVNKGINYIGEDSVLKNQLLRKKKDEDEEKIRQIHLKHQDRIKYKEKIVFDKIHGEKGNKSQQIFNMIKNKNDDEHIKYNEFIEKGIKRAMDNERQLKTDSEIKAIQRNLRKSLDQENKILAQFQHKLKHLADSKNICDRQNIINESRPKLIKDMPNHPVFTKLTLIDKLEQRKKEPTPWTGLAAAHTRFNERASDTLRQCRFKHKALKVIEDYKKINCLNMNLGQASKN